MSTVAARMVSLVGLMTAMVVVAHWVQADPSFWRGLAYAIPASLLVGVALSAVVWEARQT